MTPTSGTDTDALYRAKTFDEFWAVYLRAHDEPSVRWAHAAATASAATLLASAVAFRRPGLALLAPVVDYAIAQASHRRNGVKTSPWRRPHWHLRAELRLFCETVREGAALARD